MYSKIHAVDVSKVAQVIDQLAKQIKQFYRQKQSIREQRIQTVK